MGPRDRELILANDVRHSLGEARDVIAGYCLSLRSLEWFSSQGAGKPFGSPPRETLVARWAYSTYDNVPASHEERGHAIDLYVASGLNARIGSDELGAIRAVALEAFEALAQVPATITFWALPRADLLDPPRGATLGLSTEPGG